MTDNVLAAAAEDVTMGMVVTAALWLLFVAATLWPPFRGGPLGWVMFLLTMAVNEIPVVLLAVFCVALAVTERPVGVVPTVAAVILVGAAGTGLIWLQVRARTARAVLASALAHGLDTSGRIVARSGPAPARLPAVPWLRGIFLPFQRRTPGVHRVRNVSYGRDRAHCLDVYRGPSADGLRPVLVHLHGGGFVRGGKSHEGVALLNHVAAHGWLCLSANYRLGAAGEHPNPLMDTKRVIAWIRANAREYDADPAQIFVVGSSAGGHLAVSAALTAGRAEHQLGFETADTSIAGVIVLYGYLGARTATGSSSPALLARPDAPPMLIIHGAHDTLVPPGSTRAVADALRGPSHWPVVFVELPHTQHGFDFFASVRARSVADAAEAFLDWARTCRGGRGSD